MAIMFGNGRVKPYSKADGTHTENSYIMKTEQFVATSTKVPTATEGSTENNEKGTVAWGNSSSGWSNSYTAPDGRAYYKINPKFFKATGELATEFETGSKYFCTYDLLVNGSIIEISANSFPGTYYVTGDTYARSEDTGKDEFFQFIIPKAEQSLVA